MKQSIEVNWEILGAEFANLGDIEQRAFLHGMARELSHWPTQHQVEMQAFTVRNGIKPEEIKQLETFFSCLWFKE